MNAPYDIRGKTALITGAAAGIGRALAAELHARGASVALLDVDTKAVAVAAADLGAERALALTADVRDRERMASAVDQIVAHFGRLDVVVANAGVVPAPATLRTIDPAEFDRVVAINLTGVFNTVHPALEEIVAHAGHVVVVSSVAAFVPGAAEASYMISKAGVEQMGRALRTELAAVGASAGVAYFGVVDTGMTHAALDEHPLGPQMNRMLPAPMRRRISAAQAARVIADGIARRAPRTMAPAGWTPYSLLRGAANVLIDHHMAGSASIHALIRQIEGGRAATVKLRGGKEGHHSATLESRPPALRRGGRP